MKRARTARRRTQALDEHLRDMALAEARIGAKPAEQLRWLLAFAERDLGQLSRGGRMDLGAEVLAFARGIEGAGVDYAVDVTDDELRQVHEAIGKGLRLLANHDPWTLPAVEESLWWRVRSASDPHRIVAQRTRKATGIVTMFVHRAADLIRDQPPRRCPECGGLFAPQRRQLRHPKCAQRARDRKRMAKRTEKGTD